MKAMQRLYCIPALMLISFISFDIYANDTPSSKHTSSQEEPPAKKQKVDSVDQSDSVLTWDFARELEQYMRAQDAHKKGDARGAYEQYKALLEPGHSPYIYEGFIHFLNDTNNSEKIVSLIPEYDEAFKDNADVQLIFAMALKRVGRQQEGNAKLVELSRKFHLHHDIVFHAVHAFLQLKEPENAIQAIDRLLSNASKQANSHLLQFLKAQVYIQTRDFDKAIKELDTTLDRNPYFDRALLLRALVYEQQGKLSDAQKGYEAYLEVTGHADEMVKQHLQEIKQKQNSLIPNRSSKSLGVKKTRVFFIGSNFFDQAIQAFNRKQLNQALSHINKHLQSEPRDVNAKLFKIQILASAKKGEQAIETLLEWIHQEPNIEIWQQALHLLSHAHVPRQRIIEAFEGLLEKYPNNMLMIMYLSNLYLRAHESDKAIQCLRTAFDACINDELKAKILFQIGAMHYENNAYEQLGHIAHEAEQLKKSFAPLLNLTGYYYATHGNNLQKAQRYVREALSHDRKNIHFLDTQGVIFYKKHQYKKARTLFEKLSAHAPHDATVGIHLAKTYHKLGERKKAIETIRKANTVARNTYEKTTAQQLLNSWTKKRK